ncbi:MAG: type II toxin-antitoxin system VapC family toxin [Gemmatimonas sp.]|jgi:PIN domain nuclease of toxin-antitoxin system|uniref:type II toxin-antitoxin system VapC family toxin n=1 Tax=Gemmatimonas sp. TaxID=1962908 RepID=UPI00391F0E47|nr:hypothetical protein [Gemmatimonadota bacterium]
MSRVVLDTSALLFWTLAPHRLSTAARSTIDDATAFGWMASAISLWEIGLEGQRGQPSRGVSFAEYGQRLDLVDGLMLAPVDCACGAGRWNSMGFIETLPTASSSPQPTGTRCRW